MSSRRHWSSASALCSIFLLLPPGLCHMEMNWPYPLRSRFNEANGYENVDYSMTAPLLADGSNFPCKGYQNDRPIEPVITYTAGSSYNMSLSGSATHGGGSCQLSLSYDNGATFRVIKSMIGGCPLKTVYDFTIPPYMPAGNALLSWTWQNRVGNREFYQDCAEVSIESGYSSRKQRREAATSFEALPYLWRANLAGVDDCSTSEGSDTVYPNPGPDVEYGDDMTSDSPPTSGDCDAPFPYGQTYRPSDDTEAPASFVYQPAETETPAAMPMTTAEATAYAQQAPDDTTPSSAGVDDGIYSRPDLDAQARVLDSTTTTQATYDFAATPTYSTMTVYADCPDTITMTIYPSPTTEFASTARPSHYTTSAAACTGTSAVCPCAQGYGCDEISPCTWACNAHPTPTMPSRSYTRTTTWSTRTARPSSRSTTVVSRTYTVVPIKPTSNPSPPDNADTRPPYATGDPNRYLPCVPGTFICTSPTTWATCNWNDAGTAWVYGYERRVADGMMCLTSTSPYVDETEAHAQQALTPAGYYRDDRIVRERPHGDCEVEGAVLCADDGRQFDVCDQGGWVRMGAVAEGTVCRDGRIVTTD